VGSKQHYVTLGILALTVAVALPLGHGFEWLWVYLNLEDPHFLGMQQLALTHVLGALVAIGAAAYAYLHKPTYALAGEVVDELTKVTWPTREETGNATVVVVVTVVICSAYLGAFDAVWLALTDWLLGVKAPVTGG
jgi:preprotein translocase subunit SecE